MGTKLIDKKLITDVIEKIFLNKQPLNLKQLIGNETISTSGIIKNVNINAINFSMRPLDKKAFNFNDQNIIECSNHKNSIQFKTRIDTITKSNFITLKIPKEVTLFNIRQGERFPFEDKKSLIQFKIENKQSILHDSTILDVSDSGIALKFNYDKNNIISVGQKIILNAINPKLPIKNVMATVVYTQLVDTFSHDSYLRLGIKYDKLLPITDAIKKIK